ncbi:MORC family CW-type zinc finger protein 3-like isoform X2 [Mastacembelus armatus]|nr:MORC family CW-type zinc finger protein 3-like isoform X2 [Mastacembelus armatus]XP_026151964.1 MORC family CW-type zinc finger protein 3-like isoform X2 [Mastacembelus armatus]
MDNGYGLDLRTMHKMLSFGFSDKTTVKGVQPIGIYGNGFKSGSMRLGKDAIVFSKSKSTSCVGMLSQTYLEKIGAEQIIVPIVCFDQTKSDKLSVREEDKASLQDILRYSPFTTQEELLTELDVITPPWSTGKTGTRIIIWNLRRTSTGALEFDFEKDCYDIQIPSEVYDEMTDTFPQPQHSSHIPESTYSLRAYCSILYLKPRMQIIIRGQKVKSQLVAKSLACTRIDHYKPNFLDKPVPITFGYNTKSKQQYGVMMYHKNRLIKAYERVGCQLKANYHGVGVIGIIECNFLDPTHNKQSFLETDKYRKTMNSLATKVEEYWKEMRYTWSKNNSNSITAVEDIEKRPDQNWVQCDDCLKWRILPDGINCNMLPDKWFCQMNPDPQFRSCQAEQEPMEDDEQRPYRKTYKQQEREDKIQQEKKQQKDEEERRRQNEQVVANLRTDEGLQQQPLQTTTHSLSAPTTPKTRCNTESQQQGGAARTECSPLISSIISQAACSSTSTNGLPDVSDISSISHGPLRKRTQPGTPQQTPKRSRVNGSQETEGPKVKKKEKDNQSPTEGEEQMGQSASHKNEIEQSLHVDNNISSSEQSMIKQESPGNTHCETLEKHTVQTRMAHLLKAGPSCTDACNETYSPCPHPSIGEVQEQQEQLIKLLQEVTHERDSLKTAVQRLTCQLQDMQKRLQELSQINVKKVSSHQASQTEETYNALLSAAETRPSTYQSEQNDSDEIALQIDYLLRELDQRNEEKDDLRSQLDCLREERANLASQCEELRLKLQQQRGNP